MRTGVVMATGLGKTSVIAQLAVNSYRRGDAVVMLAHRAELIDQMTSTIFEIDPTLPRSAVGVVRAAQDDHSAPIVGATLQTLRTAHRIKSIGKRKVILWDECFVAGTLVDGRPIETLQTGDKVTSWSETDGRPTRRRVAHVMKSIPTSLVRVTTSDGEQIVCTPGHPFLTDDGWVPAYMLPRGVPLHHAKAHARITREPAAVHDVWRAIGHDIEVAPRQVEGARPGLLLDRLRDGVSGSDLVGNDERHQPAICLCPHDVEQSDEAGRGQGQGVSGTPGVGASTSAAGRQRRRSDGTTAAAVGRVVLADRGIGGHERRTEAEPLCSGHRESGAESGRRGGRSEPQHSDAPGLGRAPRSSVGGTRVADVEVLEPGSDGRYGGLCPDGFVYNLEVEIDHTYTVGSGLTVHNCHHAGAEGFHTTFEDLGGYDDAYMCGFTATMRRQERGRIGLGDVIQDIAIERNLLWAIENGYLVRPKGLTVKLEELNALNDVRSVAGDFAQGEMQQVMEAASQYVVDAIKLHAADRRAIVFAASVEAAETLGEMLNAAGHTSVVVTGNISYADRQGLYAAFRDGSAQFMVTVMVLTEGADFPMCDAVVLARPTRSSNLFVQMVGRSLRLYPGKEDALVLDLSGSARGMKLVELPQILPGATVRTVDVEGGDLIEPEPDELGGGPSEREPRIRRQGPVELVSIDIVNGRTRDVLWLDTVKRIPFVSLTDGWLVFLWPKDGIREDASLWAVGNLNTRTRQGGWMGGAMRYMSLVDAVEYAEQEIPQAGFSLPMRSAGWHSNNQAPSEPQLRLARQLHIVEYDQMTRGRLSDEISIVFASRSLDPAVVPPPEPQDNGLAVSF